MESTECYLGLGLILGTLVGALFVAGTKRLGTARSKIKDLEKQKKKADEMMSKAKEKRKQGVSELPGAWTLIFLAVALLILSVYLILGGEPF